jgi:hypothetical protein
VTGESAASTAATGILSTAEVLRATAEALSAAGVLRAATEALSTAEVLRAPTEALSAAEVLRAATEVVGSATTEVLSTASETRRDALGAEAMAESASDAIAIAAAEAAPEPEVIAVIAAVRPITAHPTPAVETRRDPISVAVRRHGAIAVHPVTVDVVIPVDPNITGTARRAISAGGRVISRCADTDAHGKILREGRASGHQH